MAEFGHQPHSAQLPGRGAAAEVVGDRARPGRPGRQPGPVPDPGQAVLGHGAAAGAVLRAGGQPGRRAAERHDHGRADRSAAGHERAGRAAGREETRQRPGHLDGRSRPDQRHRPDGDQFVPGAGRAHRQYLRQRVRDPDSPGRHQQPDGRAGAVAVPDQRAQPADQVAAGTAQPGRAGERAGQPGSRAQGGGCPAPGQRGGGDQRRRTRHPGPGSVLPEFAQAGRGRPARPGRRAPARPGRRVPAGQPG